MPKSPVPSVVTANDLVDGDVVFLTSDLAWTRSFDAAVVAATETDAERLLAAAAGQTGRVVEPYLVALEESAAGRLRPAHYRERIRLLGPTNRADLGRQAAGARFERESANHVSL